MARTRFRCGNCDRRKMVAGKTRTHALRQWSISQVGWHHPAISGRGSQALSQLRTRAGSFRVGAIGDQRGMDRCQAWLRRNKQGGSIMEYTSGWLARQVARAADEVATWTLQERELICCCGGQHHDWKPSLRVSPVQEVQFCRSCERMQVRFSWASMNDPWITVKRGEELKAVAVSDTPVWDLFP